MYYSDYTNTYINTSHIMYHIGGGRRPLDQAGQPLPIDPPIDSYSDYIHRRHLLLKGGSK